MGLKRGNPWLGARRDPGNHDNFVWSDGTPWDYSVWADSQPDDAGGVEDCVHMWDGYEDQDHHWNDFPCSAQKSFVCKKEQM